MKKLKILSAFLIKISFATSSSASNHSNFIENITWQKKSNNVEWEEKKDGDVIIALPKSGSDDIYLDSEKNNLQWEDREKLKKSFNLNGYNWDILSEKQYQSISEKTKSEIFYKISSYKKNDRNFDSVTLDLKGLSIKAKCWRCKGSELFYENRLFNLKHNGLSLYSSKENRWYGKIIPARTANKYDSIIYDLELSSSEKILKLVKELAEDRLTVLPQKINKPEKPKILEPKTLIKGEFEKTSDFNNRVSFEIQRVKKINKKNEIKYEEEIKKYDQMLNLAMHNQNIKNKKNKLPSTIKATVNEVAPLAALMVLGNPKLERIKYNADREVFNFDIVSSTNNLSMNIEFPVPIEEAKSFKEKMSDSRLIPSITFEINNETLQFKNLSIITNAAKQDQDYRNARSANTLLAYEEFLKNHKDSPQAHLAMIEIQKIKKRNILELAKREAEAIKLAEKAEKIKEAERISYLREKNIGDRVCKDGRVAFGLFDVTISAYVERVDGNNMQLRINNTEGQSLHYNGGRISKGSIIWDKHHEWKLCD